MRVVIDIYIYIYIFFFFWQIKPSWEKMECHTKLRVEVFDETRRKRRKRTVQTTRKMTAKYLYNHTTVFRIIDNGAYWWFFLSFFLYIVVFFFGIYLLSFHFFFFAFMTKVAVLARDFSLFVYFAHLLLLILYLPLQFCLFASMPLPPTTLYYIRNLQTS